MQSYGHQVLPNGTADLPFTPTAALRAYGATQSARPQRELEAEVFLTLSGRLRTALRTPEGLAPLKAAADARRVFMVVEVLVLHPSCPFSMELRAAIASVARFVQQEVDKESPDLEVLAAIADDFAGGLMGRVDNAP
jgi:flagellar biosynthesis regulator FlaF